MVPSLKTCLLKIKMLENFLQTRTLYKKCKKKIYMYCDEHLCNVYDCMVYVYMTVSILGVVNIAIIATTILQ